MKSLCISIIILNLGSTGLAQIGSDRGDLDIIFNDLTKKYLSDRRYANVEGNAFIAEGWSMGSLMLKNGKKFGPLRMKLDLVKQELIYLNGQNNEMIAPAEEISQFDLMIGQKKLIFKTGYQSIEQQTTNSFYQEVLADTVSLLKFSQKEIAQRDEFDKKKSFIMYEDYYVYYKEAITPLRNKNSLSKVFPEKNKEISSYISDHKVKMKNEEDVINLVKFINSQL